MARTRAKSKKDPNDPPLYRWEKLKQGDKVICHNYFQYTATGGELGWNPSSAGSVDHYRSSNYIQSLGSSSWFRHRAKQMVTLAEAFAARNETPPNPGVPAAATAGANPTAAAPAPAAASSTASAAPSRRTPPRPARPQPSTEAFTATTNVATMNSPNPRRNSSRAGTPVPSVANSIPAEVNIDTGEEEQEEDTYGLPCPTAFGSHSEFNYDTRKSSRKILARTLLHNAVTLQDCYFEWLSPRCLKFDIAWPDFFVRAERMAALTTNDKNQLIFPPQHQLTMDTAQRNQNLVSTDGRVWDNGIFSFQQDMKQDNPVMELLDVWVEEQKVMVKCLQIYVEVAPEDAEGSTRQRLNISRQVNMGNSTTPGGQRRAAPPATGRNQRMRVPNVAPPPAAAPAGPHNFHPGFNSPPTNAFQPTPGVPTAAALPQNGGGFQPVDPTTTGATNSGAPHNFQGGDGNFQQN